MLGLMAPSHAAPAAVATRAQALYAKLHNPSAGVFVVAHRGCHNAAPRQGLGEAPENSQLALERCVTLGVDMMELDVRRSRDGVLVIMHDATVDRTTDGSGQVANFTLAQLKGLHLRQNFGASMAPTVTAETVPTLDEMLDAARGRILLNLDLKADVAEEAASAVRARGMMDHVLMKEAAPGGIAPLADQPRYRDAAFMPVVGPWSAGPAAATLPATVATQLSATHRPVGVELVFLSQAQFDQVQPLIAARRVRLWVNTLTSVGVVSVVEQGGDIDALRTDGARWGAMIRAGIDTIQTDEPGPLLDYLDREKIRH